MAHLFSFYTWEFNFGQTIWDETEVFVIGKLSGNIFYLQTIQIKLQVIC